VIGGEESLTAENRAAEEVYLGLRTRQGLEIADEERTRVQTWKGAGWALVDESLGNPRVRLTPTGWLRLDSLAADLASQRARPLSATVGPNPSHCYI
jgi:coproporphyrinogen III oxidase-like Fe-S oxidoreductase